MVTGFQPCVAEGLMTRYEGLILYFTNSSRKIQNLNQLPQDLFPSCTCLESDINKGCYGSRQVISYLPYLNPT